MALDNLYYWYFLVLVIYIIGNFAALYLSIQPRQNVSVYILNILNIKQYILSTESFVNVAIAVVIPY